jgi:methionyl-tRNA formyltransferase
MTVTAKPCRAVVFAYHNVGVRCLKVLLAGGVDVALVVTHEDSATENIWFESVASLCRSEGISYITPDGATGDALMAQVQAVAPDLMFSFYYRHMLPASVLDVAPAFNMHGSLLPEYRGRAPVNWAVLQGAQQSGATLHEMTIKPDAGAIVAQTAVPILPDDTAYEVFGKVTVAAEQCLWGVLPKLLDGTAPRMQNDLRQGGYFGGRKPEDGRIDWSKPAQEVYNLHRAVAPPYPGAFTDVAGRRYVIETARLDRTISAELRPTPGLAVLDQRILGICGDGNALHIRSLLCDGVAISADELAAQLQANADAEGEQP